MKNNYDFSKGIKNPYADKMKNGYSVKVHFDCKQNDETSISEEETADLTVEKVVRTNT